MDEIKEETDQVILAGLGSQRFGEKWRAQEHASFLPDSDRNGQALCAVLFSIL